MASERQYNRTQRDSRLVYILRPLERRHRFGVNSLAFSIQDGGSIIYTASRDSTIRGWATNEKSSQGSCVRAFDGHVDWVNSIVTLYGGSLSSERLVSGSSDSTIKLWDPAKEKCLKNFSEHTDYVKAVAKLGNTSVVSGSLDGRLLLWDMEQAKLRAEFGSRRTQKDSIYCLSASFPEDTSSGVVASGSTDRFVSLWDSRTCESIVQLRGHTDTVRCILIKDDPNYILSAGSDKAVKLWDFRQQRCVKTFYYHKDSVWALEAPPSMDWFLSGGRDGTICKTIIASEQSTLIVDRVEQQPRENMVLSLLLDPSYDGVWCSTIGSSVRYWNLSDLSSYSLGSWFSSADKATAWKEPSFTITGQPGIVSYKIMNNRRHVLCQDSSKEISLWDVTSGALVKNFGKKKSLDGVYEEIEEQVSVASWFTVDVRTGSIGVKMDKYCFSAETYAIDAGIKVENEDIKVNIAEHVLRGLFSCWKASIGMDPNSNPKGLPSYVFPNTTQVILYEEGSLVPLYRQVIGRIEAGDERYLPSWVIECVKHNTSMCRESVKISFHLFPAEGANLPPLMQSKLTAPRILRVKKVLGYVIKEMPNDAASLPTKENEIEVLCRDQLLPEKMSLGAIRQHIWKSPDDLEILYRRKISK